MVDSKKTLITLKAEDGNRFRLIKPTFITASKNIIFIFQVPTLTLVAKDKEQKKMWMEVTLKNT